MGEQGRCLGKGATSCRTARWEEEYVFLKSSNFREMRRFFCSRNQCSREMKRREGEGKEEVCTLKKKRKKERERENETIESRRELLCPPLL